MKARLEQQEIKNNSQVSAHSYMNLNNLPHWHTEHELVFVKNGVAELMADNTIYRLEKGMCAFLNGEQVHYIKSGKGSIVNIIKLDPKLAKDIVFSKKLVCPVLSGSYDFMKVYSLIAAELKEAKEYSGIIADGAAKILVAEIFRSEQVAKADAINEKYKKLIEYITDNYSHISFKDAARYMSLSEPYFSEYFRKITGMTFTEYLNTLKVSAATEILKEGKKSVTEISIECGFGTIRNFNRVFKSLTGYCPKQLPDSYVFIRNIKDSTAKGFNPTLNCTVVLE